MLGPFSQQFPQSCPWNSVSVGVVERGSFLITEGGVLMWLKGDHSWSQRVECWCGWKGIIPDHRGWSVGVVERGSFLITEGGVLVWLKGDHSWTQRVECWRGWKGIIPDHRGWSVGVVERGSFLITEGGVLVWLKGDHSWSQRVECWCGWKGIIPDHRGWSVGRFLYPLIFLSILFNLQHCLSLIVMHECPGLSFGSLLFDFASFFFVSISSSSFFLFLFLLLPPLLLLFSSSSSCFSSFSSFSSSLFSPVPSPSCLVLLCPPARTLVNHHAGECFVYGIVVCPFSVVVTFHPWGGMGCLMVGVVCDCCREPQVMKLQLKDVYASFGQRPAASAIQSVPALFVPLRSVLPFVSLIFLGHIFSFLVTLFICFCCCLLISCLSSLTFDRFLPAPPLPPYPPPVNWLDRSSTSSSSSSSAFPAVSLGFNITWWDFWVCDSFFVSFFIQP